MNVIRKTGEAVRDFKGRKRGIAGALAVAGGVWIVAILTVARAGAAAPAAPVTQDDKPTQAFYKVCSDCHEPERIMETKRTRSGWEEIIDKMVEKGASGTDQDFDLVLQFLLGHYGMVNVNQSSPEDIALVIGLSAKDADAIAAYRRDNGNFKNYDALVKVPGIDVKKVEDHKDVILF
jgi:competence protein ComEA